jgi:hypothetical protein
MDGGNLHRRPAARYRQAGIRFAGDLVRRIASGRGALASPDGVHDRSEGRSLCGGFSARHRARLSGPSALGHSADTAACAHRNTPLARQRCHVAGTVAWLPVRRDARPHRRDRARGGSGERPAQLGHGVEGPFRRGQGHPVDRVADAGAALDVDGRGTPTPEPAGCGRFLRRHGYLVRCRAADQRGAGLAQVGLSRRARTRRGNERPALRHLAGIWGLQGQPGYPGRRVGCPYRIHGRSDFLPGGAIALSPGASLPGTSPVPDLVGWPDPDQGRDVGLWSGRNDA